MFVGKKNKENENKSEITLTTRPVAPDKVCTAVWGAKFAFLVFVFVFPAFF